MTVAFKAERQNKKIFDEFGNVNNNMRQSIRRGWFKLGKDLKAEANQEILKKPKHGRVYIIRDRRGRGRRHRASAPGETHANRSGRLRRSISWKVHGHEKLDFGYDIATAQRNKAPIYDKFVEFGTEIMEPRPSLKNAITKVQRNAEDNFQKELSKTFERTRL